MVPGTERAAGLRVQGLLATEQGYGLAGRAQQCSSTAFVRQVWRRQAAAAFTHTLHPAPFVLPPAALSLVQPPAKIDVALLRGTSADLDGNVSFEREALFCDQLNQAMAAHNSGGLVVVQARQQRSGARKARGRRGAWARQRHRHSSDLLHRGWLPKGCLPGLARADPCAALLPSAGGEQCGAGPPHLSPTVDAAVSCHALKRTTDVWWWFSSPCIRPTAGGAHCGARHAAAARGAPARGAGGPNRRRTARAALAELSGARLRRQPEVRRCGTAALPVWVRHRKQLQGAAA